MGHVRLQVALVVDNREQMSHRSDYGRQLKRGEELQEHIKLLRDKGVQVRARAAGSGGHAAA